MYVRSYLQGSENGRVVTIVDGGDASTFYLFSPANEKLELFAVF
jgi:hypothetical protein